MLRFHLLTASWQMFAGVQVVVPEHPYPSSKFLKNRTRAQSAQLCTQRKGLLEYPQRLARARTAGVYAPAARMPVEPSERPLR
jgi:hypothetical protein